MTALWRFHLHTHTTHPFKMYNSMALVYLLTCATTSTSQFRTFSSLWKETLGLLAITFLQPILESKAPTSPNSQSIYRFPYPGHTRSICPLSSLLKFQFTFWHLWGLHFGNVNVFLSFWLVCPVLFLARATSIDRHRGYSQLMLAKFWTDCYCVRCFPAVFF